MRHAMALTAGPVNENEAAAEEQPHPHGLDDIGRGQAELRLGPSADHGDGIASESQLGRRRVLGDDRSEDWNGQHGNHAESLEKTRPYTENEWHHHKVVKDHHAEAREVPLL